MATGEYRELWVFTEALIAGVLTAQEAASALQALWRHGSLADHEAKWSDETRAAIASLRSECDALQAASACAAFVSAGGLPAPICEALAQRGAHFCKVEPHAGSEGISGLRVVPEDRYVQFEVAGEGGMGVVYVAVDTELNRLVALKMIHPDAGTGERTGTPPTPLHAKRRAGPSEAFEHLAARFLQEAWVTGGLEHPGIVPVHEMGQTPEGIPYYTMRFVPGQRTLADALDEVRHKGLEERLRLLEPFLKICDTLEYAHAHGVIHRDLKPANVALGEFGEVVLLDWGLARLEDRQDRVADIWQERIRDFRESEDLQTLTSAVGTPGYMSPEAALGKTDTVDATSDVYSLGAMLFEILTGTLPHEIGTGFADYVTRLVQQDAPPARGVDASVPESLDALCASCLSRDPAKRPGDVAQVSQAIRAWQARRAVQSEVDQLLQEADNALETAQDLKGSARMDVAARALAAVEQADRLKPDDPATAQRRGRAESLRARGQKEGVRQRTRRIQLGMGVLALLVAAGAAAWTAIQESRLADRERATSAARAYELGQELMQQGRFVPALEKLVSAKEQGLDHAPLRLLIAQAVDRLPRSLGEGQRPAFSGSGDLLATTRNKQILIWNVREPGPPQVLQAENGEKAFFGSGDRLVLVLGTDGTTRIWDREANKLPQELGGHRSAPVHGELSPDGTLAMTITAKAIRLWRLADGRVVRTHEAGSDDWHWATFDRTGTFLLGRGTGDQLIRIWRVADGGLAQKIREPDVRSAQFSPDGRRVATVTRDGVGKIWDVETGAALHTLHPGVRFSFHEGKSSRFDPTGTFVATQSLENVLRVWSAEAGYLQSALEHPGWVTQVRFGPEGKRVVTACTDGAARVWDIRRARMVTELAGHTDWVYKAAYSPDGDYVASAAKNDTALLWQIGRPPIWEAKGNVAPDPEAAVWNDRYVLSDIKVGTFLREAGSGSTSVSMPGIKGTAFAIPGSNTIVTLSKDVVVLSDAETGEVRARLEAHDGQINQIIYSPDGSTLVTGGSDSTVRIWRLPTGEHLTTLQGHSKGIVAFAYSPDGSLLLSKDASGEILIWNRERKLVRTIANRGGDMAFLAFDKSGRRFASGDGANIVRVYDTRTADVLLTLDDAADDDGTVDTISIAFNQAGNRILTASTDQTGRLWDAVTGELLHTFQHGGFVYGARFEFGDEIAVTAGLDGKAKIWDAERGYLLATFDHHQALFAWVDYERERLVTTGYETGTKVWPLRLENRSAAEIRKLMDQGK